MTKEAISDLLAKLFESYDCETPEEIDLEARKRIDALQEGLTSLPADEAGRELIDQLQFLEFEERMMVYLDFAAAGLSSISTEIRKYLSSQSADNVFDAVFALAYLGYAEGINGIENMINGTFNFQDKPLISEENELSLGDIEDALELLDESLSEPLFDKLYAAAELQA